MHECRCRDQRIGHAQTGSSQHTCSVGNPAINDQLVHTGEQPADGRIVDRIAGQQLGAGDDGVAQATPTGKASGAVEVVDADVRVDEQLSHGPTRPGSARCR